MNKNHLHERELRDFYLCEMATVGFARKKAKGEGWLVTVDSESDRKGEPYFKFYDAGSYKKAGHVARISFLEPRYIDHKGYPRSFRLNREQKGALMEFLAAPANVEGYRDMTNWQRAIILYNLENIDLESDWREFVSKSREDIIKSGRRKKMEFALPVDLAMPDYAKL